MQENLKQNPKVKILVGYHKPAVLLKDEILTPIHLGRALATEASKDGTMSEADFEWMCENMIGDDTGDNISHLNRYFNELTGLYWAWKNYDKLDNPDYIGFMHYRRHFILDEEVEQSEGYFKTYNFLTPHYLEQIGLNEKNIKNILLDTDLIQVAPVIRSDGLSVYEQFKELETPKYNLDADIFYQAMSLLEKEIPEYKQAFRDYLNSKEHICYNMFIMKKELFFRYAQFLFQALEILSNHFHFDDSQESFQNERILGYSLERLLGVFIFKYRQNLNIKKFKISFVQNCDLVIKEIDPAFLENNICIVLSCDENYVNYLGVCLSSILKSSSSDKNYDICILHNGLSSHSIQKILSLKNSDNISIRLFSIKAYLENIDFHVLGHFSEATYYRFFIPKLFSAYEKIIYLDTDMIILADLAQLYEIPLENNFVLATKNAAILTQLVQYKKNPNDQIKFMNQKMKLKNPYNYFQAGLLVFDIQKCRQINFTQACLDKLKELENPPLVDQDVLNCVLEGKVKFIDFKWNYVWHIDILNKVSFLPVAAMKEYIRAGKNPCIIHYAHSFKPWSNPSLPKAEIWWSYARNTYFYEEILYKNLALKFKGHYGADRRIKKQLSYKLGAEILSIKKAPLKVLILPFSLLFLIYQHRANRKIYESVISVNENLKLPTLQSYKDYNKALDVKKHLSYRLGAALLKNPLTFIFKIKGIYKKWKEDKENEL